ncbi:hypothetical protein [Proteiniborus sp. MB09-C3]|uniref:hypothetical protein n=1 Tax=Proteiniborus sp. MB09-C3 TaxID=3050072 RepID=UPI0025544ADC|nr:hypothetical protein [Proteiniborus sp. MB09-C3]WIV13855.1 hypothetical protein QO263_09210 [Proteiniborus sp. MB09-C3]
MKNFVEKMKDFLYDATDYVLILVIIVGVVAVIGWRLDILFAKDMDKSVADHDKAPITDAPSNNDNNHNDDENAAKNDTDDNDSEDSVDNSSEAKDNQESNNNGSESDNKDENTDAETNTDEIITFKIPSGSFPPAIANILLEKGLIDNKMDFLIKSQELKLDTKLKSGEFNIKKGTSLEEIIRILAK